MAAKFSVKRRNPQLITPSKQTPREIKQLSDVDDQNSLRCYYPIIMFYPNNPFCMKGKDQDPVRLIREAIAQALVYYYPLAGRLIEGQNGKLMVDCTAEGVVFVEADAEVSLEQIRNFMQPPCPEELLIDVPAAASGILGCPLMLIQVSRLICGGFVFAIRTNHVITDGGGLVQFLNAISQLIKGASYPSPLPLWRRDILRARNPPHVSYKHNEYEVVTKGTIISSSLDDLAHDHLVHETFFFGPKEIKSIKNHLSPQIIHSSIATFDLITACLWRSRVIALEFEPDELVSVTIMSTVRRKNGIKLPQGYYGNTVVSSSNESKAKMLINNSIDYSIELVKKARIQVDEDYARSVIDYMVLNGKPGFYSRNNLAVSDVSKIGIQQVDFGFGKPVYGGIMDGGTFYQCIYSNYRSKEGEEGLVVPICLPFQAMERFREQVTKLTHNITSSL